MKTTVLHIKDEVNVKFENLDVVTRRKISDKLKFFVQSQSHFSQKKKSSQHVLRETTLNFR